jgi:hypothetical protein
MQYSLIHDCPQCGARTLEAVSACGSDYRCCCGFEGTPVRHPSAPWLITFWRVAVATCLALALMCAPSMAADTAPYAPTLAQARLAPDFLALVPAHARVTVERQCGTPTRTPSGITDWSPGWFTETQAYRRDGSAMGRQTWTSDHTRAYWRYPGTRTRVIFDGITFGNYTRHAVLVAGWCG